MESGENIHVPSGGWDAAFCVGLNQIARRVKESGFFARRNAGTFSAAAH
jgi:hypothetical protein